MLTDTTTRDEFKAELISSLREEMSAIFKTELKAALGENLTFMKSELHAIKTELTSSIASTQSDVNAMKQTVHEMGTALTSCSDDVSTLQTKVEQLSADLIKLESSCEDLEARSRRNNVRIVGVPEDTAAASTSEAVASLLKEALKLEKDPLIDRWHRTLRSKPRQNEPPRPIVVRLHYYKDCVDILNRAKTQQRIRIQGMTISIFPDFTMKTARARAAFKDFRRQLREMNRPGLSYGLVFPACLKVSYNGVQKEFKIPAEAEAFIKNLGKQGEG